MSCHLMPHIISNIKLHKENRAILKYIVLLYVQLLTEKKFVSQKEEWLKKYLPPVS